MGVAKKLLDGLWHGLYCVIEATGQSPVPVEEWPWYATYGFRLHQRFQAIRQSAAYDPDNMAPPKEIWLDNKKLERWFDERAELRKRQAQAGRHG